MCVCSIFECRCQTEILGVYLRVFTSRCVLAGSTGSVSSTVASRVLNARPTSFQTDRCYCGILSEKKNRFHHTTKKKLNNTEGRCTLFFFFKKHDIGATFTMGTYSSGAAGWILLDISITALTRPVTFSYTLSLERSRLAVGVGLISWGCSWTGGGKWASRQDKFRSDDLRLEVRAHDTRGQYTVTCTQLLYTLPTCISTTGHADKILDADILRSLDIRGVC